MKEIIELLGNNIDEIVYCTESKEWGIYYKKELNPDFVTTENLKEFLTKV